MHSVSEELDLASKVPQKATTYEELNTDDKFVKDDVTTHSKKISKSKTNSFSRILKIYLIILKIYSWY